MVFDFIICISILLYLEKNVWIKQKQNISGNFRGKSNRFFSSFALYNNIKVIVNSKVIVSKKSDIDVNLDNNFTLLFVHYKLRVIRF